MAERIVRARELREITGLSRSTCYELEARGLFPQRVQLTGNRVGWRASELEQWARDRPRAVTGGQAA